LEPATVLLRHTGFIEIRITTRKGRPRNHLSDFFWFWATKKVIQKPKAGIIGQKLHIRQIIPAHNYGLYYQIKLMQMPQRSKNNQ
jgi:hypothetical protein